MRWLICGTVPMPALGLVAGRAAYPDGAKDVAALSHLAVRPRDGAGFLLPVRRGTPALIGAFAVMARALDMEPPHVLLAGDDGKGEGSRLVYRYLRDHAADHAGWGIIFHYFLPDVDWHNRLLIALDEVTPRPLLCADAGFMYAAKMSGYARSYDLFFPDCGELAFLADEAAPHPFYTRGFFQTDENNVPHLAERAYAHENAAQTMLIKGSVDHVVQRGKVVARIDEPRMPALEAIGGTGDTLAGITSALLAKELPLTEACRKAAFLNRRMGLLANATPASGIGELLPHLADAWENK